MKKIAILFVTILVILPNLVFGQFNSTLGCFSTGSFSDMECIIGNGFMNLLGGPIYVTIFILFIGIAIVWMLHLPLDLGAIFIFALIFVFNITIVPNWVQYVLILIFATVTGVGFYHWLRSRG